MSDLEAKRWQKKKRKTATEKARLEERRIDKKSKEEQEKENTLPKCAALMEQLDIVGNDVFDNMKVGELKMLVCY